jgi:hypothetical protein
VDTQVRHDVRAGGRGAPQPVQGATAAGCGPQQAMSPALQLCHALQANPTAEYACSWLLHRLSSVGGMPGRGTIMQGQHAAACGVLLQRRVQAGAGMADGDGPGAMVVAVGVACVCPAGRGRLQVQGHLCDRGQLGAAGYRGQQAVAAALSPLAARGC